jgi:DNA-binding NtrC family response regulator
VVAGKVHFTKNVDELENYIPREQIMKELEGDEDWEYKYPEFKAGENKAMEDTAKRDDLIGQRQEIARELESATMEWIMACRQDNKDAIPGIKKKRSDIIERLGAQYWDLDAYVRARSLYDRNNVIQPGGKIDFYPAPSKANGTNGDASGSK